uniref:ATP synthase F0 subunit 8 n=1 Tax=Pupilla muscorum TaxID=225749 RepID=A0A0A6ZAC5_9EUPU|nr:ATP synthase F0 subunit 8 [Pupilla muscorum]AGC52870.1 ATP synthase F0 subunit 8 [Pupilla muscorum]
MPQLSPSSGLMTFLFMVFIIFINKLYFQNTPKSVSTFKISPQVKKFIYQ